ncbi:Gfo/Idh/MocA family oxidoreductase [Polaribacter aestuariivivens]|uniref:Gfo/Idh/MocA family oxidoreductase n=1 Tax=Polaribacter aestuariivivens TaxID=2304626 RepID=A0A5S3N9L6_9FLAO|nr:Gfo/Idh/MocA family oxidoreductase [Polaribacter aestuariivivens]TMM31915.1 Gfo/Idh/MocA family oxidoreductase [Polaribacter aestuariivivens]
MKKIKWGIIGLGKIANKFAEDLAAINDAELVAVASRSQENANEFASKFNAKKAYNSYKDLAKDSEIDAIYIATPHSFHAAHAILCMQHKKAVLCEKPFAMNSVEVEEMISVAKENNVLLMEALWTYFLPHYKFALEFFQKEKLGKVTQLEADFGFHPAYNEESRVFKKEVGGGSLLDIGIYPIFAALSTLGIPKKINANATFFKNGADAACSMVFEYENSKALLKSTLLEKTKTEAIFTCEKGKLIIDSQFHAPSSVTIVSEGKEETIHFHCETNGYNFETEHFNQLLREDKKESNIMTFEFSKNLMKTLDEVRKIIDLTY